MQIIYTEYKEKIKYFLKNKFYMTSIIIVAILSYGFYITNYAIGVDDFSQDRYINGTYLLSQGRWGNVLFAKLLNIVEFVPFWTELIAVILLIATAVLLSAFIKKEIGNIVNKVIYYILFSGILISYPIIHHIFLYNFANVIMVVSNMAMIIISIVIYEHIFNLKTKRMLYIGIIIIILPFFISMYEASCQTFLLSIFLMAFIRLYKKDKSVKDILKYILVSIIILIVGIVFNFIINISIKMILLSAGKLTPDFSAKKSPWLESSIILCLKELKLNVIDVYKKDINNLYYIAMFFIVSIISTIISIRDSIKNKNIMYVILMLLIIGINFSINIIQVRVLYRTSTSWSIVIAFMLLYILISYEKCKLIKNILIIIISFIIIYNTKILTSLFYNEHIRYEREKNIAYDIANTVIRTCEDPKKPLIFIIYNSKDIQGNSINIDNGWSVLGWGISAFNEMGTETTKFINSLGYNFNCATNEEYAKGYKEFLKIADDYKDKFVIELDEYIIVKVIYEPHLK